MDVIIVAPINLSQTTPGGIRSYALNLGKELAKRKVGTKLLGFGARQDCEDYKCLSITKDKNVSNLKFLLNLIVKVPLLKIPKSSIIHFQRPDNVLPFLFFNRKNPKIITIHGRKNEMDFIIEKGQLKGFILNAIDKLVISRFDKIIAINEDTKEYYISHYPNLKNKIFLVPTGVDITIFKQNECKNRYNPDQEYKTILYVGRFDKVKGLDLLLSAVKILHDMDIKIQLVLVGAGPEKFNLETTTKELGLKNVQFIDTVNHNQIPDIMACADVFALCSSGEGMPTVVLESLACGVPVVSTKVGDVHKVVFDGVSGYLINKRTPEEIAKKLRDALNNGYKFKTNCINIAREYSWENIGNEIMSVYEKEIENEN